MSRKLLIGLVPILAMLAVMPAAAQATPHYYRNAVLIPQGERVPILEWGKLRLTLEPPLASSMTCETVSGGYVENPVGGGPGTGATLRLGAWNCEGTLTECPSGEVEIEGKQYEKEFELIFPPQSFPWPTVLEEPEPTVVRTNTTGVVMKAACMAHEPSRSAAGEGGSTGAGENEQYVLPGGGPPGVTCVSDETHKWNPQNEKGSNQGPSQSKLVFNNAGTGYLGCAGGEFGLRNHESLRVMGYKGSELITVH